MNINLLFADVTLPAVIASDMVLQREKPVQIWGWAEPGESVAVEIANNQAKGKSK